MWEDELQKKLFLLACGIRWYGVNCSQPCVGHWRDGITCNHVTGLCDRGCDAGWTGYMCNKGKAISMFFFFIEITIKRMLVWPSCNQ